MSPWLRLHGFSRSFLWGIFPLAPALPLPSPSYCLWQRWEHVTSKSPSSPTPQGLEVSGTVARNLPASLAELRAQGGAGPRAGVFYSDARMPRVVAQPPSLPLGHCGSDLERKQVRSHRTQRRTNDNEERCNSQQGATSHANLRLITLYQNPAMENIGKGGW